MSRKSENQEDEEDYRCHGAHISMSRLSLCTTNDDDDINIKTMSIESFDADVERDEVNQNPNPDPVSSASDDESSGCYSLPATPPRHRRRTKHAHQPKECVSETDAPTDSNRKKRRMRRRRMRSNDNEMMRKCFVGDEFDRHLHAPTLITTAKGGIRSLELDLEEVKACSDLGFDLDLSLTPIITTTRSNTSSASDSPIHPASASWRISSPGDDPRDVKARLKVWAHAVAIASASASPPRYPTA